MTNKENLKAGLALQNIAMSVDDKTLERIKEPLKYIEDLLCRTAEKSRDTVSREAVMEAIKEEYNVRFKEGSGLKLAYIEKAVNSVPGSEPEIITHEIDDPPEDDHFILISLANYSIPCIGRYRKEQDGSGSYYEGDEDESLLSYGLIPDKWMEIPKMKEE